MIAFVDGNVRTGQSPAQASVAPSPLRQEPQVPQPSMGAPYTPQQLAQNSTQEQQDPSKSSGVINNRYPVVKLGRLSVSTHNSLSHSDIVSEIYTVLKQGCLRTWNFLN